MRKLLFSSAPSATLLIRLLAGGVFLSEGVQKFLFPGEEGVGRFAKIGIPSPEFFAPFVGAVEIICGGLLVLGLITRLGAIALIIDMIVAIATTKVPILQQKGFWAMAHEARTDWSMLMSCIFLLIVGAGNSSLDHLLTRRAFNREGPRSQTTP